MSYSDAVSLQRLLCLKLSLSVPTENQVYHVDVSDMLLIGHDAANNYKLAIGNNLVKIVH